MFRLGADYDLRKYIKVLNANNGYITGYINVSSYALSALTELLSTIQWVMITLRFF